MEDSKKEQNVYVHIQEYKGDKPIEVIIRKGEAPKPVEQLATKAPIRTDVSGVISTPTDWLDKRISEINQKKAHVLVNREDMTITLIVNEDDEYNKGVVKGKVEFTEIFTKTKINDPKAAWEPERLGQFFRLNRGLFTNKEECMKLVSALKNFTAHAKSEIQKQKDPNGSRSEVFRQEVETNLPKDFTLSLSIFKGTPKVNVVVEFDHYVADGDCLLQLVSPGANEIVESYRDKCLDDVIGKIRQVAPEIAIMEV